MSRTCAPIQIIIHSPQTESSKQHLAERMAQAHAEMVCRYIQLLSCPSSKKQKLLDSIIQNAASKKPVERPR